MSDWSDAGLPAPRINPYSYIVDADLDRTPFDWPRKLQEQISNINRSEFTLEFLLTHAELKLAEAFIASSGYSWFTMDLLSGITYVDPCYAIRVRLISNYTVSSQSKAANLFSLKTTVEWDAVYVAPPAVIVGMITGEAFRSTDGGLTWTELTRWLNSGASLSTQYITALDTDNKGKWLAGFYSGITDTHYLARSTDNGITWSAVDVSSWAGSTNRIYDICFGKSGIVLATVNKEVWGSSDYGETWEMVAELSNASWSSRFIATDWDGPWMGRGGTEENWSRRLIMDLYFTDLARYAGAGVLWDDAGWYDQWGDWNGPDWSQTTRYLAKQKMGWILWLPPFSGHSGGPEPNC